MNQDIANKIITVRANQFSNRGGVSFEDAVQEGWVGLLKAIEDHKLDLGVEKDRNTLSICIRNQIVQYMRRELSNHGMTRTGQAQTPNLYNPFLQRQRPIDHIVHGRVVTQILVEHIFPICPKNYMDILSFYLNEAESDSHWQLEYAETKGVKSKTVNRYMASLRRRIPQLYGEFCEAKRKGETPNLRFMKDRLDTRSRRVLSLEDENKAVRLHESMGLKKVAAYFDVDKKVILNVLLNHRRKEKRKRARTKDVLDLITDD